MDIYILYINIRLSRLGGLQIEGENVIYGKFPAILSRNDVLEITFDRLSKENVLLYPLLVE